MPSDARENDSAANRNTNATTLRIIIDAPSYKNTVKFKELSEHKHCDNAATNANSEHGRSRMKASSAEMREYRGNGR
jgi:hypothetical protein